MDKPEVVGSYDPAKMAALMAAVKARKGTGPSKPKHRPPRLWLIVGALIATATLAVAGNAWLSQQIPSAPAVGLIANCSPLELSKAQVALNSSGFVVARCPGGGGAFRALTNTQVNVLNFTVPSPYTLIVIYPADTEYAFQTTCTDNPAAVMLYPTQHIPITFGYAGDWSYCLNYTNAQSSGLPSFPIGLSWGSVAA